MKTLDTVSHRARNAKIIATLGPASNELELIRALFEAGADVFRFNFSHGTYEDHRRRYELVRQVERELNRPIGVLMDLQGPKLRLGQIEGGRLTVRKGDRIKLDLDEAQGTAERVPLPHPEIFAAIESGDLLLIDDGKVRLRVLTSDTTQAQVEVCNDGVLSDRKGVNVPGAILPLSAITEKDERDLAFGLELGVDWIALSFVQRAKDIVDLKTRVGSRAWVMAKLEKPAAFDELDDIVSEADAVMVARGDLGVESPPEEVPVLQKRIVRACREKGKPVVVATQMLESMIQSPVPTRAEVSDVAGAIYDGVDAVMLSAESASGSFPVQAVDMMDRIIRNTEQDSLQRETMQAVHSQRDGSGRDAISAAIRTVADSLDVSATVAFTASGATALRVAHERPRSAIVSMTPYLSIARRLSLVWGVHSTQAPQVRSADEIMEYSTEAVMRNGFAQPNKAILIAAGTPFGVSGTTNLLRIVWVDEMVQHA